MMLIVGVDCATDSRKTGVCRASFSDGRLHVDEAFTCSRERTAVLVVGEWLRHAERAVIALDAPLGWPEALGRELHQHAAGEPLAASANDMFNRVTDKSITVRFRKRPLEVGANLIARTAHAALALMESLRQVRPIALGWGRDDAAEVVAIEVYPAATRLGHRIVCEGTGLSNLPAWADVTACADGITSEHARDAVLCAVAAADYCAGRALGPGLEDLVVAKREGWIWAPPGLEVIGLAE